MGDEPKKKSWWESILDQETPERPDQNLGENMGEQQVDQQGNPILPKKKKPQ